MIQVKNLCKHYGSHVAVDNISFDLEAGQILGFLGPNGAGKSTTIRILTCYHPATSGSAKVAGFDVFSESMEVRRTIGYLPESTPLYPEMRVREYLDFRAKLHGLSPQDRRRRAAAMAEKCWLSEFINRPIQQLSKGMKQRVGLAAALIHDPKLLILDEPTIGLDPTQIRETRRLIKELGEHHTIMLSSHILHEVEQICTRVIIIAKGKLLANGAPDELRDRIGKGSRLIAELRGPQDEVRKGVGAISGIKQVDIAAVDGWNRLAIEADGRHDIREDVFKLCGQRGWALRELRREVASLEEFFVRVTSGQEQEA